MTVKSPWRPVRLTLCKVLCLFPLVVAVNIAAAAPADDFAAGKTLGKTLATSSKQAITSGDAKSVVPNYTDKPAEAAYYASGDLVTPAATVAATCKANPNDPGCGAMNLATATRPASTVSASDPALSGADVGKDPTKILGSVAGTYGACTTGTPSLVKAAVYEQRNCSVEAGGWAASSCDKTLTVYTRDQFTCTPGTWYAQQSGSMSGYGSVGVAAYCDVTRQDKRMRFQIQIGSKTSELELDMATRTPSNGGLPALVATTRTSLSAGSYGVPFINVYAEGPGCDDSTGQCAMRFHFHGGKAWKNREDEWANPPPATLDHKYRCSVGVAGNELLFTTTSRGESTTTRGDPNVCWEKTSSGSVSAATLDLAGTAKYRQSGSSVLTDEYLTVTASNEDLAQLAGVWAATGPTVLLTEAVEKPHLTYVAGDYWQNGCAAQEAQTVGMPADGVNPEMDLVMPDVAMIGRSQCVRTHSTCVDSADRVIDGQNVHRACWQWRSSFACATLDAATSTCDDGTVQHCTQVGAFDCAVPDGQGACLRAVGYYECKLSDAVYEPTLDCGGQNYCYGNSCYDTSYSQDQDFGKAVTMLESQREAGRYLDTENMTVFKGTDNRCDRELYGLNNCCKTGGSDAMRMFSTLAMAAGAVESVGKVFSSYSYDSLFTAEQPEWASKGFSALTGTEMDSGLQTLLSGNLSVAQFIGSMAPGPWTMAMLAVQLSGLLSCSEDSQVTAMKRDAKLCHDVGDYCSGRDLLGGCIKRTRTFCCFPSKLGRIINEQGRPQLSGGWGTPQAPACGGFSAEELAQLDFSKMDLSEFYAEITRNSLELSTAEATVVQTKMTCYYGGGACGP